MCSNDTPGEVFVAQDPADPPAVDLARPRLEAVARAAPDTTLGVLLRRRLDPRQARPVSAFNSAL
jgi:hypothetical protein